jgi:enoyl-CoA hydratase/carnithine racemase
MAGVMTSVLLAEDRGAVRVLTLNRPDKLNALNQALTQALYEALLAADGDAQVGAVVLTGAGRAFCAGADVSEFKTLTAEDPQAIAARGDLTMRLHLAFTQIAKPVVAAARGHAVGGGCGLALACDMVVASESARLGYPEIKRGIVAAVVLANLVRQVGRKTAFELVALGESVTAERALALGLVNRVVPDNRLLDEAVAVATTLAGMSRVAMAATKRLFHRVADMALDDALAVGRDANIIMRGYREKP